MAKTTIKNMNKKGKNLKDCALRLVQKWLRSSLESKMKTADDGF